MPKKVFVMITLALILTGCSAEYWTAKFYMFEAENAYEKAYELRKKKVPYENRLKEYGRACGNFLKAYDLHPRAFTLLRIESALESCIRVKNETGREAFESFRGQYVKAHPTEAEYGDFMPNLDEG